MPDATGRRPVGEALRAGEPRGDRVDQPRPVRRGAEQLAQPGAVPGPGRYPHADPAAHPGRPAPGQRGARRAGLATRARHAYAAVSEHTARDWRSRLPAVTRRAQRDRPAPLAAGRRGRNPSPTWPSGPPGSPRRRACRSPSRPAGPPGCGWPSPARSATSTTSSPTWRRCSATTSATSAISTTDELPRLIRRGRVFVSSPRWPEPFGLALVEAMACGTPVAALPAGAAAEVVSRRPAACWLRSPAWPPWRTRSGRPPPSTGPRSGPACSGSTTGGWSARTSSCCSAWSTPPSEPRATRSTDAARLLKGPPTCR